MAYLLVVLMVLFSPVVSIAGDSTDGYVRVTLEYKAMSPGTIQVVDGVCRRSRSIECAEASIKVNGDTCRQKPDLDKCKEARALLATSFCVEGLIFEDRVVPGDKIQLKLCASDMGYGNMYVKDLYKESVWTNFFLLNDGSSVSYP